MLVLGVLLFIPGWFGGGDAKLMAAIALWIGSDNLVPYMLYVALAGGLIATASSRRARCRCRACCWARPGRCRLHRHDAGIPYGIALAAGALLVYPHTVWFASLAALRPASHGALRTLYPRVEVIAHRRADLRPGLTTH